MNKKLTKADEFYIEKNRGLAAEELAAATQKPLAAVQAFLSSLPPPKKKTYFDQAKPGVTTMTAAESHRADGEVKTAKPDNKHLFIIDPSQPVM
jgi:hypothetical protein